MKKLVSLLITLVMIVSVSAAAFADAPPHFEAAFPFGDKGGVYSKQIEAAIFNGVKTDPDAAIWTGLPWQTSPASGAAPANNWLAINQYFMKNIFKVTDGTQAFKDWWAAKPTVNSSVRIDDFLNNNPTINYDPTKTLAENDLTAAQLQAMYNYLARWSDWYNGK